MTPSRGFAERHSSIWKIWTSGISSASSSCSESSSAAARSRSPSTARSRSPGCRFHNVEPNTIPFVPPASLMIFKHCVQVSAEKTTSLNRTPASLLLPCFYKNAFFSERGKNKWSSSWFLRKRRISQQQRNRRGGLSGERKMLLVRPKKQSPLLKVRLWKGAQP